MNSYDLAEKIINRILLNMSPERCTWGEKYQEAYRDLHDFKADMIQDAKSEIEKAGISHLSEQTEIDSELCRICGLRYDAHDGTEEHRFKGR